MKTVKPRHNGGSKSWNVLDFVIRQATLDTPFSVNNKFVQCLIFVPSFKNIFSVSCSGIGAGGGCMERWSPGSALSNLSASGREQEAVIKPSSQRIAHPRGRLTETRWCVVRNSCTVAITAYLLHTYNDGVFLHSCLGFSDWNEKQLSGDWYSLIRYVTVYLLRILSILVLAILFDEASTTTFAFKALPKHVWLHRMLWWY